MKTWKPKSIQSSKLHLHRSPHSTTLKLFQSTEILLSDIEELICWNVVNSVLSALLFFFGTTKRKLHDISLFKSNTYYECCVLLSSLTKVLSQGVQSSYVNLNTMMIQCLSGFSDSSSGQIRRRSGLPKRENTSAFPLSVILSLSHLFPNWWAAVPLKWLDVVQK